MIQFRCKCSHLFSLDIDRAGGEIQCPDCGLLVDIPLLSDLPNLAADGTYTISTFEVKEEADRLHTLYETFTRDTIDQTTGHEIDLRPTLKDVIAAHKDDDEEPLRLADESPRPVTPKYDPETGELIRPIELTRDEELDAPVAKVVPTSKITYAAATTTVVHGTHIAIELLMPMNVVVMFFVFIPYFLGQLAMTSFFVVLEPAFAALLLSHYGNVIDEIGTEGHDELPRPLRHLSLGEDLWKPFYCMAFPVLICYAPVLFLAIEGVPWQGLVAAGILFSIPIPALMLTLTTSGSFTNLRPDRVLAVMTISGFRYVISVLLYLAALTLHLWTWIGVEYARTSPAIAGTRFEKATHFAAIYPLIAIAIYLMHYFCWHLGMIYRRHEHEFPWVFHQQIRDHRPTPRALQSPPLRGGRTSNSR